MIKTASIYLFFLLTLTHTLTIEEERPFIPRSERQLSLLGLGVTALGLSLGFMMGGKGNKKDQLIHWGNDKEFEKRFLGTFKYNTSSKDLLNLVIENYAASIGNACSILFKSLAEEKALESIMNDPNIPDDKKSPEVLDLFLEYSLKSEEYKDHMIQMVLCDKFKYYIQDSAAYSKDNLDPELALFNFRLYKLRHLERPQMEDDEEAKILREFLKQLTAAMKEESELNERDEPKRAPVFKTISQIHKKYMYALINNYLDKDYKIKRKDSEI